MGNKIGKHFSYWLFRRRAYRRGGVMRLTPMLRRMGRQRIRRYQWECRINWLLAYVGSKRRVKLLKD